MSSCIQELNNGPSEAVVDADGRQYPWYSVSSLIVHLLLTVVEVDYYRNWTTKVEQV